MLSNIESSFCPTAESEGLGEGQHGDVPAVVVNAGVHKGQIAAVIHDGLHLCHVGVDWFVIDGAQQHTPAVDRVIPPGEEQGNESNIYKTMTIVYKTLLKVDFEGFLT